MLPLSFQTFCHFQKDTFVLQQKPLEGGGQKASHERKIADSMPNMCQLLSAIYRMNLLVSSIVP